MQVVAHGTSHLVRYDAAKTALAECRSVDEVKEIRDKAEAMAAYARLAKDSELIEWATEIKVRAERKAGAMLAETPRNRGTKLNGPRVSNDTTAAKLADLGVSRDESSRWQRLAAMPEKHFESAVETAKAAAGEVTTAFMLREARQLTLAKKPAPPTARAAKHRDQETAEDMAAELDEYRRWHAQLHTVTGKAGRGDILAFVRRLVLNGAAA